MHKRLFVRCDLCSPRRPGLIWLGGTDWVECPQCAQTPGKIEIVEEEVKPRGKLFLPGDTKGLVLRHPLHAKHFG